MSDYEALKAKVFVHSDQLVIVPSNPLGGIGDDWWPTGGTRLGCVLTDTKRRLGVSKEALLLMREIEVGCDAIGDIDWWRCYDGTYAFSWWGPLYRIINPDDSVSARAFREYHDQCQVIPNNIPEDVLRDVETALGSEDPAVYREPFRVEPNPYANESNSV
jgi:hypothetical protein